VYKKIEKIIFCFLYTDTILYQYKTNKLMRYITKIKIYGDSVQIIFAQRCIENSISYNLGTKFYFFSKKCDFKFVSEFNKMKSDCDTVKENFVIEIGETKNKKLFYELMDNIIVNSSVEIIFCESSQIVLDLRTYTNIHTIRLRSVNYSRFKYLPINLPNLYLSKNYTSLEQITSVSISNLIIDNRCNKKINFANVNVTHIDFGFSYNHPIDNLNTNVKKITVKSNIQMDNLPFSIEELNLCGEFNSKLDYLSNNIQVLKINTKHYSHQLDNLPSSIKYFELNISKYDKSQLDDNNSFDIQELNNLPNSIETIKVQYFTFMLKMLKLPSSIKKIIIATKKEKFNYGYIKKLIDYEKINAHLQTMCDKQKLDGVVYEIEKK